MMKDLWLLVSSAVNNSTRVVRFDAMVAAQPLQQILQQVLRASLQLNSSQVVDAQLMKGFRFALNGKDIRSVGDLAAWTDSQAILRVVPRLLGGKGGFGSQMKKEAMSQKKITNWDLSRNLQGRRVRDVNNEKKLVEFLKKQKKEEETVEREMKDYKDMKKESGADNFGYQPLNNDYRERSEIVEETIANSVSLAFLKNKKKRQIEGEQKAAFEEAEASMLTSKKLKPNEEEQPNAEKAVEEVKPVTETKPEESNDATKPEESNQTEATANTTTTTTTTTNADDSQPAVEEKPKPVEVVQPPVIEAPVIDAKKAIAIGANSEFAPIELNDIKTEEDLEKLGDAHLKNELTRLGLKAGGMLKEKVRRLWEIKLNPSNLFNPKYMAKKK